MPTGVTLQVYFNMDEIVQLNQVCKQRGCEVRQFVKQAVQNALGGPNGPGSNPQPSNDGLSTSEHRSSEAGIGATGKKQVPSSEPPNTRQPSPPPSPSVVVRLNNSSRKSN